MKQIPRPVFKFLLMTILLNSVTIMYLKAQNINTMSPKFNIEYVGTDEGRLLFNVRISQQPDGKSRLRIMDGDRNVLLEERVSYSIYNRRFKIECGQSDRIRFELSGRQFSFREEFLVNLKVEEKYEIRRVE